MLYAIFNPSNMPTEVQVGNSDVIKLHDGKVDCSEIKGSFLVYLNDV